MRMETERLILRPITQADFDDWFAILGDGETMQHYPAPYDKNGVQRWIDWTLRNYELYGFGLWAVILKDTGAFIGDCGITMQNINGKMLPEIGYHINKAYWRRGFGSEAARRCMQFAFEERPFPAVYSYMPKSNTASWGVAVKNGMKLIESYCDENHVPHLVYSTTREEWKSKKKQINEE